MAGLHTNIVPDMSRSFALHPHKQFQRRKFSRYCRKTSFFSRWVTYEMIDSTHRRCPLTSSGRRGHLLWRSESNGSAVALCHGVSGWGSWLSLQPCLLSPSLLDETTLDETSQRHFEFQMSNYFRELVSGPSGAKWEGERLFIPFPFAKEALELREASPDCRQRLRQIASFIYLFSFVVVIVVVWPFQLLLGTEALSLSVCSKKTKQKPAAAFGCWGDFIWHGWFSIFFFIIYWKKRLFVCSNFYLLPEKWCSGPSFPSCFAVASRTSARLLGHIYPHACHINQPLFGFNQLDFWLHGRILPSCEAGPSRELDHVPEWN